MTIDITPVNAATRCKCHWCAEDARWLVRCDEAPNRGGYACEADKRGAIDDVFRFAVGELGDG